MDAIIESMTVPEVNRLAELESIIDQGQKVFIGVGRALLEIRDGRLYRAEHKSFEMYLAQKWPELSRRRAYQLMDAAVVVGNVNNCTQIPTTESQTRPLAQLEPEAQQEVWRRAVDTAPNNKPTAAHIQQTVKTYQQERTSQPDPEPVKEEPRPTPPRLPPTEKEKFAKLNDILRKCDAIYDKWRANNGSKQQSRDLKEELYDTMTEYENGIFAD